MERTEWVELCCEFDCRLSLRTIFDEKKEKKEKTEHKENNVNAVDKDWKCGSVPSKIAFNE